MSTYVCANCLAPITGEVHSIHRDGPDRGPEVPLCEKCNGSDVSDDDIWSNIRTRAMVAMPGPDASRAEVDGWRASLPVPIPHEAPLVANGPTPVCAACGVIRIGIQSPFCRECKKAIEAAA